MKVYGKSSGTIEMRTGIFQSGTFASLICLLCMITLILRKQNLGYVFKSRQRNVSHLLFMVDPEFYGKDESKESSLLHTVYTFIVEI